MLRGEANDRTWSADTDAQTHEDATPQRHTGTAAHPGQEHKNTKTQKHKDTKAQRHKDIKPQRHKDKHPHPPTGTNAPSFLDDFAIRRHHPHPECALDPMQIGPLGPHTLHQFRTFHSRSAGHNCCRLRQYRKFRSGIADISTGDPATSVPDMAQRMHKTS
eukprot:2669204-Rhodomonas_salina.1